MKNLYKQYGGLKREIYVLFIGRMVTNMGSMVWPVLTLIMTQKMGMSASQASILNILAGFVMLPAGLIGGKVADRFNKKVCIIVCDIISVIFYIACGIIPLSGISVALMITAATFQMVEHPAYSALIADLTQTKDRERAYSLSYLGANLGLIASPTIAGLLFVNHLWLSFIISGVGIGMSTILIFFLVKDITPVKDDEKEVGKYQQVREDVSIRKILSENRIVLLYLLIWGLYSAAYRQYNFLMPIDLSDIHGEAGAMIFGTVTSLNCIVVVIFTPLFTNIFKKMHQTWKSVLGEVFLFTGLVIFLIFLGHIWLTILPRLYLPSVRS